MNTCNIIEWTVHDVSEWARRENLDESIIQCIDCEKINGKSILIINEYELHDLREKCKQCNLKLGDTKMFWLAIRNLQRINHESLNYLGFTISDNLHHLGHNSSATFTGGSCVGGAAAHFNLSAENNHQHYGEIERISPPISVDGRATSIQPEVFKTMISLGE